MKTAAEKMRVRSGARTCLRGAPASRLDDMGHHGLDIREALRGRFDYLHLFTTSATDLDAEFPKLAKHLRERGALWVSWPKGGRRSSDLSLPRVIEIGYRHGLVESTTIGLDEEWSAIKFTFPKAGKDYHNSFGHLRLPRAE